MQRLGSYLISVMAVAVISGILLSLIREGTIRSLLKLSLGVLLMITALSPISRFTMPDFSEFVSDFRLQGEMLSSAGEAYRREVWLSGIKQRLESYILDKAEDQGAALEAKVHLDQTGIPVSVEISGESTESLRRRMEFIIAEELGISKEDQQWNGWKERN